MINPDTGMNMQISHLENLSNEAIQGLELRNITYSYKRLKVLKNISFSVSPTTVIALLGPSGCGKSTLLHIIAGLLAPDSGELRYRNKSCILQPGWVGYMQQNDLLLPWKTVLDNVALPLLLKCRSDARKQAAQELAIFGLESFRNYYPHQLSGGMRQRVAFMRSCILRNTFLLLDEPFSRLDFLTREAIYTWFQQYLAVHGVNFVLVTHDPEEALLLADEILLLSPRPAEIIDRISVNEPRPRHRRILAHRSILLETIIEKMRRFQ